MSRQLISQAEFARMLNATRALACQLVTRGKVKHHVVVGHRFVDRLDAERYVRRREAKRQAAAARKAARTSAHA